MAVKELISEKDAAKQAGVSAKTLTRFSEAGYLAVEIQNDGSRMYSASQINEIFGTFQASPTGSAPTQPAPTGKVEMACKSTQTTFRPDADTASSYYTPVSPAPIAEKVVIQDDQVTPQQNSKELETLHEELQRLRNLVNLQERILDMKDSELVDLRSQRDWLRTRVEKLEEKGDRDQVLLLSETQAIRQLIGLQNRPRSTMRNLLDWFGLGSSESTRQLPSNEDLSQPDRKGNSAIVVNRAANG
jgi:hypothetical protein